MVGYTQCDRSGFLRPANQVITEFNGATVSVEFADITPGFGTRHPQDVYQATVGGDPTPAVNVAGVDEMNLSKQDQGISDREIKRAIRENRPPRPGF
jgi:hypothetical protein